MKYYYLSGVSHISHFNQIRKKYPDVIPATLSKEVIQYFEGKEYVENLVAGYDGPSYRIPISLLRRSAINFSKSNSIEEFIFNERLIDLNGIYFAIRLKKLGIKNVIYYDDCIVTKFYKLAQLRNLSLWAWLSWFKNFAKYLCLPIKWYETHDGIYLGVSKKYLVKVGITIEEFTLESAWNPMLRGSTCRVLQKKSLGEKVVIALGYSVTDEQFFYDAREKEDIYRKILAVLPNCYIKYHPNSTVKNEFLEYEEIPRNKVIEEYADEISVVVSDYSLSLIELSHVGVNAISILDIVKIIDKDKHQFWKDYLLASAPNINFPKTLYELILLCKERSNE